MGLISLAAAALLALAAANAPADTAPATYTIQRGAEAPRLSGLWDEGAWADVPELRVSNFLTKERGMPDSGHRPKAEAKVLYDDEGVYVHFRVEDQYVRSVETQYHGRVWEDSAVEFFVQPKADRGYFNFEINCGGTMLLSYHENKDYTGEALRPGGSVPWELAKNVAIYHSMPAIVEPEIAEPVTWHIEFFIPYTLFEAYLGPLGAVPGQTWRANFYKIAETNSHPHYASWSPILEGRTFHAPAFFGELRFASAEPGQ